MIKVWRVDNELLTVTEAMVNEDTTPIHKWLYALYGDGQYCYFVKEEYARAAFKKIVLHRIEYLTSLLD